MGGVEHSRLEPRESLAPRANDRGIAQLAAIGLLALGVVGGAAVGIGARAFADDGTSDTRNSSDAPVAWDCPGGNPTASLSGGDRVFVTGRHATEDGWLQIRNPTNPSESWWVRDSSVEPDQSVSELEQFACSADEPAGGPDERADAETTTVADSTTTSTLPNGSTTTTGRSTSTADTLPPGTTLPGDDGAATTSPPPTPPPPASPPPTSPPPTPPPPVDSTGPSLSVSLAPNKIWESDGLGANCGDLPRVAALTAQVADPSGIAEVRARWTAGSYQGNVVLSGGAVRTGDIGPHPYHSLAPNTDEILTVTVTATDGSANSTVRNAQFRLHSADQCFG